MYHDSRCQTADLKDTVDNSFGNRFLSDDPARVGFACGGATLTLAEFQAKGFEKGSTAGPRPPVADVIAMGEAVLGM